MELLYNRIFWCDISDPEKPENRIRIFCDRNGDKIYIEQGNSVVEVDIVSQAYLASFLVKKMTMDLVEKADIPKDVTKNL